MVSGKRKTHNTTHLLIFAFSFMVCCWISVVPLLFAYVVCFEIDFHKGILFVTAVQWKGKEKLG
jgi:hypothetical protein